MMQRDENVLLTACQGLDYEVNMAETKRSWWKAFVGSFLGALILFGALIGLLLWKFTPLIRIDGNAERVTLLGGLIDIDGKGGRVKVGSKVVADDKDADYRRFEGSRPIDSASIRSIVVPFNNGRIELSGSTDGQFHWSCNLGSKDTGDVAQNGDELTLSLAKAHAAECGLKVPSSVSLKLQGKNGDLSVHQPHFSLDAELGNGRIEVTPDPASHYLYDVHVGNGKSDRFESNPGPNTYRMALSVENGVVSREMLR